MKKIKLIIIDDQVLFRKGLKAIFKDNVQIEIVGEAGHGVELLKILKNISPDILLLDIEMPKMDGVETLEKIKKDYPEIKIIMLTMHDDERLLTHLLKKGANGYLLKNTEPDIVLKAILSVNKNGYFLDDYSSKALLSGLHKKNGSYSHVLTATENNIFTSREKEILELISKEFTAIQIAEKLFISKRTVEGHRKNMMEKSGTTNTAGLIMYALKNKILKL